MRILPRDSLVRVLEESPLARLVHSPAEEDAVGGATLRGEEVGAVVAVGGVGDDARGSGVTLLDHAEEFAVPERVKGSEVGEETMK